MDALMTAEELSEAMSAGARRMAWSLSDIFPREAVDEMIAAHVGASRYRKALDNPIARFVYRAYRSAKYEEGSHRDALVAMALPFVIVGVVAMALLLLGLSL